MDQGQEGTIVVVVEARKNVAIRNHGWMSQVHPELHMNLCVGGGNTVDNNQSWVKLVDSLCSCNTNKEIWWTSIGTVELVLRYLIRCNRDKEKRWTKGWGSKSSIVIGSIVFALSDWEENMPSYGAVIQLVYEYSQQINRRVIRIMAMV